MRRIELNTAGTDYISIAAGVDLGTLSGWTASVWYDPHNRNHKGEATVGGGTAGVLFAQTSAAQKGTQLDVGVEAGTIRLTASDGSTTKIVRAAMPGCLSLITITMTKSGSTWTMRIGINGRTAKEESETFALGLNSGETDVWLASRDGNDVLKVGSVCRCRGYLSALSEGNETIAYANHRPQDSAGPTPDWDIWFGDGAGDTATSFVDQSGNGRNAALVGTWATGGSTQWNPLRPFGLLFSTSGTSTTGWTANGTASISSGTSGVRLTPTQLDFLACAQYTAFPMLCPQWIARAVVSVATEGVQNICLLAAPARPGAGAVAVRVNLTNAAEGVMTLEAAEFDENYGDGREELARSNGGSGIGTVPVAGGGNVMPNTGAQNGDQFELIMAVVGEQLTGFARNLTRNLAPVRCTFTLDNAIVSGARHTMASPGYLAVGALFNTSTIEVISLEAWSLAVENPYALYLTHSLSNVDDEGNWLDGYVMRLNELREAAGDGDKWIEPMGRPGARINEFTDFDTVTGELEGLCDSSTNIAACIAVNTLGADGDTAAQVDLTALQDYIFDTWATPPNHLRHICEPPLTAGSETTLAWRGNLTAVAALRPSVASTSFAMHQGMGDPPGSNNQTAGDFVDAVHMTPAGMDRAANFLQDDGALEFPDPPVATGPRPGSRSMMGLGR